jgi:glutathione synthase/RimK-type ligase-like ATP-grasp enzyme
VVKPTVSAGARHTGRYQPSQHDEAAAHARSLLEQGRAVLVQPYLAAVDEDGETGLVFVGDRYSHGFRKEPLLHPHAAPAGGPRDAPISPREPTVAERELAEAALDAVAALVTGAGRADLLYARVDLVPGPDGPVLMELELIEPSLYLHVDPAAPARTAAAIVERLQARDG